MARASTGVTAVWALDEPNESARRTEAIPVARLSRVIGFIVVYPPKLLAYLLSHCTWFLSGINSPTQPHLLARSCRTRVRAGRRGERACSNLCRGHFFPLVCLFDFSWSPCLVEPRLQWTVHAKDHKPALARNRLQPVVLLACRGFWREINVERAIRVLLYSLSLASDCRKALAGLQH